MIRFLFNCDDFGRSHEINRAVLKAHKEGVLGSTSLMVTGAALEEAVDMAKANPSLKVGLHLALTDMKPVLPVEEVSCLVDETGHLPPSPGTMGFRLAWDGNARAQAADEIAAQFQKFHGFGLTPWHVDGHHHLHMHPFVFRESLRWTEKLGFRRIRVVREWGNPLPPRQDDTDFLSKAARHFTFAVLASRCRNRLGKQKIDVLDGVLGLWETGRMTESYLLSAIPQIRHGRWEIYSHLGAMQRPVIHHEAKKDWVEGVDGELQALLSPEVRQLLRKRNMELL